MKLNVKHIWWDLDGTLYKMPPEFEDIKYQRRFELYSEIVGKPITEDLKKEYMELYEKSGSHSAIFVSLGKDPDYWQIEHQKLDLIPFISADQKTVEMFEEFKKMPYKHSLLTNRKPDYIHKILSHLKIDFNLFTHIITIDDLSRPKPHPEAFRQIIQLSGVSFNEILYVGDRIKADIIPAKQEGLKTVLVWSKEDKTEADYTFPHIVGVISLFK